MVKIYTAAFNVAKEICVDMVQTENTKKDIDNTDIPKKDYDIEQKYVLDNDKGRWYLCVGQSQISKAKELHDRYPKKFSLYDLDKVSRKNFIDVSILKDIDKVYDKYYKIIRLLKRSSNSNDSLLNRFVCAVCSRSISNHCCGKIFNFIYTLATRILEFSA